MSARPATATATSGCTWPAGARRRTRRRRAAAWSRRRSPAGTAHARRQRPAGPAPLRRPLRIEALPLHPGRSRPGPALPPPQDGDPVTGHDAVAAYLHKLVAGAPDVPLLADLDPADLGTPSRYRSHRPRRARLARRRPARRDHRPTPRRARRHRPVRPIPALRGQPRRRRRVRAPRPDRRRPTSRPLALHLDPVLRTPGAPRAGTDAGQPTPGREGGRVTLTPAQAAVAQQEAEDRARYGDDPWEPTVPPAEPFWDARPALTTSGPSPAPAAAAPGPSSASGSLEPSPR
jgi:hypothetical protein